MQIELFEQFLLDPGAHTIAEENAVWHDHAASAAIGAADWPPELSHNKLKKEKRCLRRLLIFRKVRENSTLFFAPERRVRNDDIHPIFISDLPQREPQSITRIDLGILQTMKQEIHLAEEIR